MFKKAFREIPYGGDFIAVYDGPHRVSILIANQITETRHFLIEVFGERNFDELYLNREVKYDGTVRNLLVGDHVGK